MNTQNNKNVRGKVVDQRELGRLEGRVDALEKNISRIELSINDQLRKQETKIDVMGEQLSSIQSSINSMSNKAEGSKKTILFIVTIVAGASAALTWILDTLRTLGRFG